MIRLGLMSVALVCAGAPAADAASRKSAERVMRQYAQCLVRGDREGARSVMATVPNSKAEVAAGAALMNDRSGCMRVSGQLRMRGIAFRTALAQELYRVEFPTAPLAAAPAAVAFQGSGDANLARYDVARCVATRDPANADRYVRSDDDDAAQQILREMMPAMAGCVPSGAKLGFDKVTMRGLLAEGLYHIRRGDDVAALKSVG